MSRSINHKGLFTRYDCDCEFLSQEIGSLGYIKAHLAVQKMGRISIVSDASLTLTLRAQCEQALRLQFDFKMQSYSEKKIAPCERALSVSIHIVRL